MNLVIFEYIFFYPITGQSLRLFRADDLKLHFSCKCKFRKNVFQRGPVVERYS